MTTGMESQQSGSFVIYYKGVSLTITQRDPSLDMKPLIDESMKNIDYALFLGALPSWNKETNKEALTKPVTPLPVTQTGTQPTTPEKSIACATCGALAVRRQGVSKAGKPYKGIFCSTEDKTHTEWL